MITIHKSCTHTFTKQESYQEILNDKNNDDNNECSICFETIDKKDCKKLQFCKHVFHKKCISKWCYSSEIPKCPLCRTNIIQRVTRSKAEIINYQLKLQLKEIVKKYNNKNENNEVIESFLQFLVNYPHLLKNELVFLKKIIDELLLQSKYNKYFNPIKIIYYLNY